MEFCFLRTNISPLLVQTHKISRHTAAHDLHGRMETIAPAFLRVILSILQTLWCKTSFFSGLGTHVFSVTCVSLGHKRKDKRQWKQFCSFSSIPWTLLEPPWGPWAAWPRCCCWWWWCWWCRWSRPPSPIIPTPALPLCLTKGNTLILSSLKNLLTGQFYSYIAVKRVKCSQNVLTWKKWTSIFLPWWFEVEQQRSDYFYRGISNVSQKSTFSISTLQFKDFLL